MAILTIQPLAVDSTNNFTFNSVAATANITSPQLISNVATGTAPLTVTSTTLVPNLYVARSNVAEYTAMTNATSGNYYVQLASSTTANSQTYANSVFVANTSNGAISATTFVGNVSGNITGGNISGAFQPRVVSIADGTSVTINGDTTDIAVQTNTQVAGTLTINAVTGTLVNGQKIIFRLQSANIQALSWNSVFVGSTDLALPTASSGSNKYDYVGFIYNTTATQWQLLAKNFGF